MRSIALAAGLTTLALAASGCAERSTAERVEACVESIKFGAFVGDANAVDIWTAADQSDDALREVCSDLASTDPDRLTAMNVEWEATQRLVNAQAAASSMPQDRSCDPSYPAMCIRMNEPDLNCANVGADDFPVMPPDRHGFDTDGDGFGCTPGRDSG